MTVSTTGSRISYAGNGATTAFSYPFLFLDEAHLVVIETNDSTGVETLKTLTTDYTTTGAGDAGGGTVTMLTAPASGVTLVLSRSTTLDQQVDYQSNDTFPAETHEGALDKLTLIAQENATNNERSLVLSAGDTTTDNTLPAPSASQLLGWNATADALINYSQTALDTTLLPTLVANQVLGVDSAGSALEFKFTVPAASAGKALGWNSGGTDIENITLFDEDTTANLTVGYTTDLSAVGSLDALASDTYTVVLTTESMQTLTIDVTGTIAPPSSGNGVTSILATTDSTGGYTLTTSGFTKVIGTYDNTADKVHRFNVSKFGSTSILEIIEVA